MDSEKGKGYIAVSMIGFCAGIAFTILITTNFGIVPEYHEAKTLCEKELPRHQVCGMTFVPVDI